MERSTPALEDDDRTRIPMPAPARAGPLDIVTGGNNALPNGTRLNEFEIEHLIAEGGFGIVYACHDHSLNRKVAIKEYMPSVLANRINGQTVAVKSERHAETFDAGLRSFVNESRLLAQFDHPSLVRIYRFWEANGTAYMVMPHYAGVTLKDALRNQPSPPDEATLKRLLAQLLQALAVLHAARCFHRDIAPDNIIMRPGERPLLLDFGAARRVIGDRTHNLTVILKPGYAPIEQYAESPALKQGPWTDIYALAALAYFAITGTTPIPAIARMVDDRLPPLSELARDRYSPGFLAGLDRALAVTPRYRPKSVDEFAQLLELTNESLQPASPTPPSLQARHAVFRLLPTPEYAIALAILVLVVSLSAWIATRPAPIKSPPTAMRVDPGPVQKIEARTTLEPITSPIGARPAFDTLAQLDQVVDARNRDHGVAISIERSRVLIRQDVARFTVRSTRAGYLYVIRAGADQSRFQLMFPNARDRDNRIDTGGSLTLPRKAWEAPALGPAGLAQYVAIVSETPLDFVPAGATRRGDYAEFRVDIAAERLATHPGTRPFLAGALECPESQQLCSERYGAARFVIEEIAPRN